MKMIWQNRLKLISNDNSILGESDDDAVILSQYLYDVNL